MPPAHKPIAVVFFGDTQVGSDEGLCIPGYPIASKKDKPCPASSDQQWLYETFKHQAIPAVREIAKTHYVVTCLGGDAIDGVNHHGTTQTWGTTGDQREQAVQLLKPLVDLSDDAYGVTGTPAHVADVGDDDRAVYRELGVKSRSTWILEAGGRLIHWAHHGIGVGKREHTLDNDLFAVAKDEALRADREQRQRMSLIVAHDRHVAPEPVKARGVNVAICPCWQLSTYYGDVIAPRTDPTIGFMVYYVDQNNVELTIYGRQRPIAHIRTNQSRRVTGRVDRSVAAGARG